MSELRLGAFKLVRPIAEGGMAVVWGGLHGSELPVAVKILTGGDLRAPMVRSVFRNEVRAVAKLNHPGIISILDFGEVPPETASASGGRLQDGSPYLVMEYAGGGTLGKRKRLWTWTALRRLTLALLDALAHAHSRGIVHRDLKPGNILLSGPADLHGGIKLTDFGIAWVGGGRDLQALAGTVQYMAPEQHSDDFANFGPWTDLYALGCVLWRVAAGHTPFAHAGRSVARAHLFERPPRFSPRFPVPEGFEAWLRTLLHKEPQARYASAADARRGLCGLPLLDDRTEAEDLGDQTEEEWLPSDGRRSDTPVPLVLDAGQEPEDEVAPTAVALLPPDWRSGPVFRVAPRLRDAGLGLFALREIPLFGREKPQDLLWRGLLATHEDGLPRAVLIRGPSGVGKSRLAQWIAERAHELGGIRSLWVRGDDLQSAISAHLEIERPDRPEAAEELCERLRRDPEAPDWVPSLLSGLSPEGTADPVAFRTAIRRLLELRAMDRPAILVVDDAQSADQALELARELVTPPAVGRRAVLAVLVARDDDGLAERPQIEDRISRILEIARARTLKLGPLEGPARAELLEHLGLAGALAARVDERSKGNPQFAIQLVNDWIQRGLLTPGPDGFVLPEGAEPPIPDDLHETWSARILQILKDVPGIAGIHLERAAALGMEVDQREWDIACDDPHRGRSSEAGQRLRRQLVERLRDARLIEELPQGFRFAHPMLRESVERISRKAGRWASHHQAIAALLSAGRQDPARIGRHRLEAGEPAEAIDLLLDGIDQGIRRWGVAQASVGLRPLEQALREASVPDDDVRWARLWCRQAQVMRRRGMPAEAMALAERARQLADRPGAEEIWAEANMEIARSQQEAGDFPGALQLLQETAARLNGANVRGKGLAATLTRMAVLARMMHQLDDAERWATQANGVLARLGVPDPALEGYLLGELAVQACRRGRHERALELFREALPLLRKGGEPLPLAEVENNRGDTCKNLDRWGEAESAFLEAIRLLESVGAIADIPRVNLALCRMRAGSWLEARAVADEAARIGTRTSAALAILVRAVCNAATGELGALDRELGPALGTLRRAKLVDPDAAWLGERGAQEAAARGAIDPACAFAYFAREQLSALQDMAGVDRISRMLAGLDVRRRRG